MLILFVDDDPDDYELFCDALNSFNKKAKCLHAADGQEALDLLNDVLVVLPDYILLDINMPVMGGKECLARIKSNPRLKDSPVVVYSTTTNFGEMDVFKELGALEFIVKPGRFNDLVSVLSKVLTEDPHYRSDGAAS